MKDNKQVWKTVGISALTSAIVFLILYFALGGVMLGPSMRMDYAEAYPSTTCRTCLNAKACSADDVCEVNALLVEEDSVFRDDPRFELGFTSEGHSYMQGNAYIGESAGIFPAESSGNLYVENDLVVGGEFDTGEDLMIGEGGLFDLEIRDGETVSRELDGTVYEFSAMIFSANEVVITVNGEASNSLSEGQSYFLPGSSGSLWITVEDILYTSHEGGLSMVVLTVRHSRLQNYIRLDPGHIEFSDLRSLDTTEGNGYVCADRWGKLFRSEYPC
ncbi:MAG: hypothetical protein ABH864_01685 [archaeon]